MVDVNRECCVYWIHRPQHIDMFTEGYIGITANSLHSRFISHKHAARKGANTKIARALRKYDDLVCDKILIGTVEYCLEVENRLRPCIGIGYNIREGGQKSSHGKSTSTDAARKISEALKLAYTLDPTLVDRCGKKNKGRKHSAQTREKLKLRNKSEAWCNGVANIPIWLMAKEVYDYVALHECGHVKVAIHFGRSLWTFESVVKKIKGGWNPYTCQKWQEFYDKNTKEI